MKNIIRVEKREKFTIINSDLLEDTRLEWATKGILGYLLSKPDNWVLQVNDLRKQGNLGRDAIYKRIKNAIESGYITRIDHRDEKGRVTSVEYIVREESIYPLSEKSYPVKDDREYKDINKDRVLPNTKRTTTTTIKESEGIDYLFHDSLSNLQKHEITKLLASLDYGKAQDILYELSGFIDKKLIQKDAVSLVQGLVQKAKKGEFCLRLGIKYKESANRSHVLEKLDKELINSIPDLKQCDSNNSLVKKMLDIKNRSKECL